MMPTRRLTVEMPGGQRVTYWTQDAEGMAARFREGGLFASHDMPLEVGPTVQVAEAVGCVDWAR